MSFWSTDGLRFCLVVLVVLVLLAFVLIVVIALVNIVAGRLLAGSMLQIPMNHLASTKARENLGQEETPVGLLREV